MQNGERELIKRIISGDREAYRELVERYQKMVFAVTYRLIGSYEDALDMTQEAFVRAYKSLKSFKGRSKFSTWLYRIAVNTCYKTLKKKDRLMASRSISLDEPIKVEDGRINREMADNKIQAPDEEAVSSERMMLLREALRGLDKEHYEVVALKALGGLSYDEISKELCIPVGTVMSRLYRARRILKDRLKALDF
ncbi:MAG: hypothetical protein AUJ75_01090 [Candidatus Omnitrophica bacterium CG1_02_49_10]|nr:MAG: hypothetical protein AUJ75_01090 [Candidatus Omnitrophica bacterium CG1_02_49_10]